MVMSSNKIGRRAMKATQTGIDDILKSAQTSARATVESDMKGGDEEFKKATGPSRDLTRGEAFKLARMKAKLAGEDPSKATFTWGGKTYNTRMAGEGASKPTTKAATTTTPKASAPKGPDVSARTKEFLSKAPLLATRDMKSIQNKPTGSTRKSPINAGRSYRSKTMNDLVGLFSGSNAAKNFEKSQKAKGYAKGGSIDGCAIRGKTRAPMKKGK